MTETDASAWRDAAAHVLTEYALDAVHVERIPQGLVNLTLNVRCRDGTRYVLQRLHPVFTASVNDNIAAVTAHLAAHGMATPRLVPTTAGASCVRHDDAIWRMLTFVQGHAFDRLAGPHQARAAGGLLARFHRALVDYAGPLVIERPPIHDYPRHEARLNAARAAHTAHRLADAVTAVATTIAELRAAHPVPQATPPRLVHGDPKISNLMFDDAGQNALCLIDLDTLNRMPLALELGDALRSWCNPRSEDASDACIDLALFDGAIAGYAAGIGDAISGAEIAAVVPATLEIHLELATRFLVDALEESYFGWDATRYAARGEHNLARARGQLAAARSFVAQLPAANAALTRAFAR